MVEETIAEYIAAQTAFATGTDIFLATLPTETREGIVIRLIRDVVAWGRLTFGFVTILLFYQDYPTARANQDTISALMDNYRGSLDGSWAVAGEVEAENLGLDSLNRYVTSVNFLASYT